MENKPTIFFGSSDFSLKILENFALDYPIQAVVTSPPAPIGRKQEVVATPVALWAQENGVRIFEPKSLNHNPELIKQLSELGCQFAVLAFYGKIVPKEILEIFPKGIINVHPSLLPKYRGASPIQSAILNGENQTGVSLMLMDEQLDHGPILSQTKLIIEPQDTFTTLLSKSVVVASQMLKETIPNYLTGELQLKPQDESEATLTKLIKKEDGKVFWEKSNTEIFNQYRGLQPWPGIWTEFEGKKLKILKCEPNSQQLKVGQLLQTGLVGCGSGSITILEVQLEGGKPMSFKDFSLGHKITSDSKLL